MSIVIIDNRSINMEKEDFNVIRPHYIDRFEKKSIVKMSRATKECKHSEVQLRQKTEHQKSASHQYKKYNIHKEVMKMKHEFLEMLKNCREDEQLDKEFKKLEIIKRKKQHKSIIEGINQNMAILKKQIYELYKHSCGNLKEKLCLLCNEREKIYKQQVFKYLEEEQNPSTQQLVLQDKINQTKKTGIKINRQNNSQVTKNIQNLSHLQHNQKVSEQTTILHPTNHNQKSRKSARLSTFRINRKNDKNKSMRKKGLQNQCEENISYNNSIFFNKENERKNKKKNSARKLENNIQSSKNLDQQNDVQTLNEVNIYSKLVNQQKLQNHSSKRSFRKSIIKMPQGGKSEDLETHSGQKSKFYDLNIQQKNKKSQLNEMGGISHNSKSIERRGKDAQKYRVVREKSKHKLGIYQRSKNSKKSQIFIDLSELESCKNIEEEIVHREREEIQELMRQREKSIDNAQSKLSRYQRERLIYGYLKKQLVKMGCVDELSESGDYLYSKNESRGSFDSQEGSHKYIIKDRKQSLLSRLNIFNQSINFEDMKTKIQNVIQEKEAQGQNLVECTQLVINHGKVRREQKIVEKFLAEVLKINDLKRLLRKKFSKELDWSPRMREMHQFYTYLQFNLQNFRMHLKKNTQNNWRKLVLEGKGEEFSLDELIIKEDLGHYKGLENTEITEFQHHKEIECSMRYYGIEVKRLQQLKNFFYPPPELPHLDPEKLKQRSLKQIKQCNFFESQEQRSIFVSQ